ncbi:MAG: ECF transporter S component [Eubacteriales bacterium]
MKITTGKLVAAAMMAALCAVATMVIAIPSPMQGYVNLGDCIVLLCGWLLGPWWGFAAAAIGSAMADVLLSYAVYAPATFLIKGAMALVCGLIAHQKSQGRRMVSGVAAEAIMVAGYFGFAGLIMGEGLAAASSVPGNLFQGAVGIVAGLALYALLQKSGSFRHLKQAGIIQ